MFFKKEKYVILISRIDGLWNISLYFGEEQKGILKEFNDTWLILESNGKKGKEITYYRLNNIKGVVEVK